MSIIKISDIIKKGDFRLIVSSPVVPEACYILNKKFGSSTEIKFIEEIISVNLHIEIIKTASSLLTGNISIH